MRMMMGATAGAAGGSRWLALLLGKLLLAPQHELLHLPWAPAQLNSDGLRLQERLQSPELLEPAPAAAPQGPQQRRVLQAPGRLQAHASCWLGPPLRLQLTAALAAVQAAAAYRLLHLAARRQAAARARRHVLELHRHSSSCPLYPPGLTLLPPSPSAALHRLCHQLRRQVRPRLPCGRLATRSRRRVPTLCRLSLMRSGPAARRRWRCWKPATSSRRRCCELR